MSYKALIQENKRNRNVPNGATIFFLQQKLFKQLKKVLINEDLRN